MTKTDEQERADFEAWAQNSFELHRHSAGEYSSNFTQTAWAAWQARAALQSQDREDAFCVWHNDPETDSTWETGCGNLFILNDGTPAENRMKFCCYCGKPIREAIDHARRIEGDGE